MKPWRSPLDVDNQRQTSGLITWVARFIVWLVVVLVLVMLLVPAGIGLHDFLYPSRP